MAQKLDTGLVEGDSGVVDEQNDSFVNESDLYADGADEQEVDEQMEFSVSVDQLRDV